MPNLGSAGNCSESEMKDKSNNNDENDDSKIKYTVRIVRTLAENGPLWSSELSYKTNMNHSVMLLHLEWLDQKGLVQPKIENKRIIIHLTEKGMRLYKFISEFFD